MADSCSTLVAIADATFDPTSGEIRRGQETTRLAPKVAGTLAALCDRAGEVVSKQEFLDRVWTDTFVTDDGLWHSIAELRRIFDDDPRSPRVIETLPRRGYRLIAPVETACGASPLAEPRRAARPLPAPRRVGWRGRRAFLMAAVTFLLASSLSAWVALARRSPDAAPESPDALLEQGLEAYGRYTSGHNERAIELLETAVDRRPESARAHAALADAYAMKAIYFSLEPWWKQRAEREAQRAIELDPSLAEAHKAQGLALAASDRRSEALVSYRRALEIRPDYHQVLNNLGLLERARGNLSEAAGLFRRAAEADPTDGTYRTNYGATLRLLGLEEEAARALEAGGRLPGAAATAVNCWERALLDLGRERHEAARLRLAAELARSPRDRQLLLHAAEVELIAGRRASALPLVRRAVAQRGGPLEIRPALLEAMAEGELGDRPRQIALEIGALEKRFGQSGQSGRSTDLAAAHLTLGERAAALDRLGEAVELGYRDRLWLAIDPIFEPLHGERRFQEILDRLELLISGERASFLAAEPRRLG